VTMSARGQFVIQTVGPPIYPYERTSSESIGMSQTPRGNAIAAAGAVRP
jgi:hypothetical protein